MSEEGSTKQVSTLLYCLGEEAEEVLLYTNITPEEKRSYKMVIAKFDSFFKVVNAIQRSQKS